MLASSRTATVAVICVALTLLTTAPAVLAVGPATVTVRVEGLTETKLAPTQVTTTTAPVVKDGNPEHACPGTNALGALQLATNGNWGGPWNGEFKQYEIYSIEGETHLFEKSAPANYFWAFWLDEKEASLGACEAQLQPGDRVLFFPSCFGAACPPAPGPLGIEAPAGANVGEAIQVTVKKYSPKGEASPAARASLTGAAAPATTDAGGHATLTFASAGQISLRVSAPESVRTETTVCVHAGNDGTCGTTAPTGTHASAPPTSSGPPAPYTGPFALVAKFTGLAESHVYARGRAPRLLTGTVTAHSAVTSVSIALRRRYHGRCTAYSGPRALFIHAACGTASFFRVSRSASFSYLLPAALAPGRYVLDVAATDAAGDRTTLARGTSRIVFYVR
jgi:hypothetical protein